MGSNPDYIATVSFSKLTCEIIFQIYHEFAVKENIVRKSVQTCEAIQRCV